MRFAWVPGSPFAGDPDKVQRELDRIATTQGSLTPEAVVAAARSKRSLLHPLVFDVEEHEAAARYYRHRATKLLTSIVVCDDAGEPTPVRQNVRVVTESGPCYLPVDDATAHRAAIERLQREMRALARQLEALQVYPTVMREIEEALAA